MIPVWALILFPLFVGINLCILHAIRDVQLEMREIRWTTCLLPIEQNGLYEVVQSLRRDVAMESLKREEKPRRKIRPSSGRRRRYHDG